MRRARAALVAAAFALVVAACGGAGGGATPRSTAAKAPSNASMTGEARAEQAPGGYAAPPPSLAQPPPPPSPSSSSSPKPPEAQGSGADAWAGLLRAEDQLDAGPTDCANACRALGSMDRAAGQLCAIADAPSDAPRCDDAKKRVRSARDRVRAACGGCAGGPSVDRDAPIPSAPAPTDAAP